MTLDTSLDNLTLQGTAEIIGNIKVKSGAAACTSNAVTISQMSGIITTEALTTAAGATQDITLTNTHIAETDIVLCNVSGGSSTTGIACVSKVVPGSNGCVITLANTALVAALNGTVKLSFLVLKV